MPTGCDDLKPAAIKTVHKSHYNIILITKLYITTFRPKRDFFLLKKTPNCLPETQNTAIHREGGEVFSEFNPYPANV